MKEIIERLKDLDQKILVNEFREYLLCMIYHNSILRKPEASIAASAIVSDLMIQLDEANKVKRVITKDRNFPLNFGEKVTVDGAVCVVECIDFFRQEVVFANTDGVRFYKKMCDLEIQTDNN